MSPTSFPFFPQQGCTFVPRLCPCSLCGRGRKGEGGGGGGNDDILGPLADTCIGLFLVQGLFCLWPLLFHWCCFLSGCFGSAATSPMERVASSLTRMRWITLTGMYVCMYVCMYLCMYVCMYHPHAHTFKTFTHIKLL